MSINRILAGVFAPAAFTLGLAPALHAQTAPPPGAVLKQNSAPPALPQAPTDVLTLPAPEAQSARSTTPIPVRHIRIEGNTLLPTELLRAQVTELEDRTVTLAQLQEAAERLTRLYQSRGYPLARAFVPAQQIRDGQVQIRVVEPRFDRIAVTGSTRLNTEQARRTLGLAPGQPIAQDALDRGLLLLNRTPGVRVAGALVPGAQPDTSTLQVQLSDAPVLHAHLHADTYGSEYTGRTRGGADVSLDNPFGHGAQLAVTTLTTSAGLLHAGGFSATSPDLGHGVRAGAYGSRTLYRLGDTFAALAVHGRVNQAGVDVDAPLVLAPGRLLEARLDLLRNGFVQQSSATGTASRSHIGTVRLSLNGARADAHGTTSGGVSLSHGKLFLDSPDARAADAAGPGAAGGFWVSQLQLQRDQPLPHRWDLRVKFSAQLASRALDGSEKFYLGGPYAVMSAPANAGGGEAGALLDLRLAHPLVGNLQGAVLLQSGKAWQRGNATTAATSEHLSGAGLGLDYHWSTRLNASVAYVHTVGHIPATEGKQPHGQWWARLTLDL